MAPDYVVGVDVGTGSARAGVFDLSGRMIGMGVKAFPTWHPQPDYAEQSSREIWKAVCSSVKMALKASEVAPTKIAGVAFDATCSLVALDSDGRPVTVSPDGNPEHNIIVWMDHRAVKQAQKLTAQGDQVIKYLGGTVSPEHQIPKLMWLKENMPDTFKKAHYFFDLPDYLTWQATGRNVRSLCTTVCKWTYLGHKKKPEERWSASFFKRNGLGDLLKGDRIGAEIEPMGDCAGGLSYQAAHDMGLEVGTPVGVGIIDAHAGGLGVLGMTRPGAAAKVSGDFNDVLCLIGGTSTCHMVVSQKPRFVKGVWGPYYSAMVPGLWLNEGGQSATGALLDFVIQNHHRYPEALKSAKAENLSIYEWLNREVDALATRRGVKKRCELTADFHMLPDFHGNRSPNADPLAKGAIHGLSLHSDIDDYVLLYYATIQAIAYGTREIIEALNAKGYTITRLHACGGGTKNPLWMQEHADVTGCEVLLPKEPEAVLLGSALLASVASGIYQNIPQAMAKMCAAGDKVDPDKKTISYHNRKMQIHRQLYRDQLKYRTLMSGKK